MALATHIAIVFRHALRKTYFPFNPCRVDLLPYITKLLKMISKKRVKQKKAAAPQTKNVAIYSPKFKPLSIVAIAAHLDDCWLGMGGTALKAVRKGHRVTMIQGVSTYGAWPPVAGRGEEIKPRIQKLADQEGIKLVTLGYDYMRMENKPSLVDQISQVLVDVGGANIFFCHWENESNQDHVALGAASRIAAMHANCFKAPKLLSGKLPREIYQFRIDRQTKHFIPDTYVNIGDVVFDLLEICTICEDIMFKDAMKSPWLTVTDHLQENRSIRMTKLSEEKFAHTLIDGANCNTRYAEGYKSYLSRPIASQLLAQI